MPKEKVEPVENASFAVFLHQTASSGEGGQRREVARHDGLSPGEAEIAAHTT